MNRVRTAAVLGLGLIGGSLARDLAARGVRVLGHDRDAEALRRAEAAGVVHAALDDSLEGLEAAEVAVLAVPVAAAPALLETALPRLGGARLVTDVGSTKRGIVSAAETMGIGTRFVGAHPIAGDHRSGWDASRAGLFLDTRVYLSPAPSSLPEARVLAEALWRWVGSAPEMVDAEVHDRRLAWTSHLPQAVSTALALALAEGGVSRETLGSGGRDLTRLAGSSPEMWTGIALENAAELAVAAVRVEGQLRRLREALAASDAEGLLRYFEEGRAWFEEGTHSPCMGGSGMVRWQRK